MKHVMFKAWQGENSIEFPIGVLSAQDDRKIAVSLSKFFQWFDTMKNFKVETGFIGREPVYFSITVNGKQIINTQKLALRFKAITKFRLNRSESSKIRFTALAVALLKLALSFDGKAKRVSEEVTVEKLLQSLRETEAVRKAEARAAVLN